MENQQATKRFFHGALILTFAGLISKVISAGYRIPLQNITGDIGFYIYQQIYPILGITLMLSLYGFPTAISKLVAENQSKHQLSLISFYLPVFILLCVISTILYSITYFNAGLISSWMGDSQLKRSIQVAALTFLLIPFTSLLRGVFQGLNNMRPTATSQIIEQVVRVMIIIIVAIVIVKQGNNLYEIGSGAAFGALFGGLAAIILLCFFWFKHKPIVTIRTEELWRDYIKTILLYGLMIGLNHMMLLLIQFSDAFTLIPGLLEYGYSLQEAKVSKGIFDRGQPLIQLGTVVGSSLALAVIPSITKARMDQQPETFSGHIQSSIRLSFYLSAAATAGLIAVFPYVNTLLYQNNEGTSSLRLITCAILLTSLVITIASILQGLGKMYITTVFIIVGIAVKWLLNITLVPLLGINGSAVATVASLLLVLILNVVGLKRQVPSLQIFSIPWRSFGLAMTAMLLWVVLANVTVSWIIPFHSRISYLAYVLIVCSIGAIVYLITLYRLNGFNEEEVHALGLDNIFKRRK